mgnify:CR=1 FL=1
MKEKKSQYRIKKLLARRKHSLPTQGVTEGIWLFWDLKEKYTTVTGSLISQNEITSQSQEGAEFVRKFKH